VTPQLPSQPSETEVNVAMGIVIVPIMCGCSIGMLALYGNSDKWYRYPVTDGVIHLTDFFMYFAESTRYSSEFIHL
jgi:hypothetical protein